MKTLFFGISLFAAVATTFVSCDDDQVIVPEELPKNSSTFLSTHFADASIVRIEKEKTGYAVDLSSHIEVDFNSAGEWVEVDGQDGVSIPTSFLLPTIVTYIGINYPGDAINGVEKIASGYEVDLLQSNDDLLFDQSGVFIRLEK